MLKDRIRRTLKGKQLKWACHCSVWQSMWYCCLQHLCTHSCFYRCLLPVVLGRRESITPSNWRKEVASPRHHVPRVRSTDMRQGSHFWQCLTAHPEGPIQGQKVPFHHPHFCILVIRVISQTGYISQGGNKGNCLGTGAVMFFMVLWETHVGKRAFPPSTLEHYTCFHCDDLLFSWV